MAEDRPGENSRSREEASIPLLYQGPAFRPVARYRPLAGHPYVYFSPASQNQDRPSCGCWRLYSYPDYVVVPLIEDNRRLVRATEAARTRILGLSGDMRRQARRIQELEAQLTTKRGIGGDGRVRETTRDKGVGERKRIFSPSTKQREEVVEETPASVSRLFCTYCGKMNHTQEECWRKMKKCLFCGSHDHQISNCPQKSQRRGDTPSPSRKMNALVPAKD